MERGRIGRRWTVIYVGRLGEHVMYRPAPTWSGWADERRKTREL
jgi:hypothetical protein